MTVRALMLTFSMLSTMAANVALDHLPWATVHAPALPRMPQMPQPRVRVRTATRVSDAVLLATIAKSEDPTAADAVIWTVLNRARKARASIATVATPGAYHGLAVKRDWSRRADQKQFAECLRVARAVLAGRLPDPTAGATHFHRIGTPDPPWAPEPAVRRVFGAHEFYRERGPA
jgi:Cell Wall Hydrolase